MHTKQLLDFFSERFKYFLVVPTLASSAGQGENLQALESNSNLEDLMLITQTFL